MVSSCPPPYRSLSLSVSLIVALSALCSFLFFHLFYIVPHPTCRSLFSRSIASPSSLASVTSSRVGCVAAVPFCVLRFRVLRPPSSAVFHVCLSCRFAQAQAKAYFCERHRAKFDDTSDRSHFGSRKINRIRKTRPYRPECGASRAIPDLFVTGSSPGRVVLLIERSQPQF